MEIEKHIYGFQFQKSTKWRKGLTEDELAAFENDWELEFSPILKDYYRNMNGVDKPGINVPGRFQFLTMFSTTR